LFTSGNEELKSLIMEIENGPTPEFAVIIVLPSGLKVNPNG